MKNFYKQVCTENVKSEREIKRDRERGFYRERKKGKEQEREREREKTIRE
jgi:hypothetical protein